MTRIILCFLLCGPSLVASGQILNQDASGKSALVWNGSSISLDFAQALAKVNHYGRIPAKKENRSWIYGVDLQAKTQNGMGALFSKGKFTPQSELSILIGYQRAKFDAPTFDADQAQRLRRRRILGGKAEKSYDSLVTVYIIGCTAPGDPATKTEEFKTSIKALPSTAGWTKVVSNITALKNQIGTAHPCPVLSTNADKFIAAFEVSPFIVQLIALNSEIETFNNSVARLNPNRTHTGYIRFGANAQEFKYDHGDLFGSFDERFKDTLKVNGFIELGYNLQKRKHYVGFALGFERTTNFLSLDDQEYTYGFQDTLITSGVLKQQKTFTAYSGEYGKFYSFYLMIDYVHMIPLGESHYLGAGPYLRSKNPISTDLSEATMEGGIAFNYINGKAGKFLGGVFAQYNDLGGTSDLTFKENLRIGINARFTLGSIFNLR